MTSDPTKRTCQGIHSAPDKCSIRRLMLGFAIAACTFMFYPSFVHAKTCTVQTKNVVFGNYDVFSSSNRNRRGRVRVTCNTQGVSVTIGLSPGVPGSYNPREMAGPGGDQLNYNLYTDATYSTVWGNGSAGTATVSGTTNSRKKFNPWIYGQIPSGQDVSAGSYTDSLVVTVTF